jgi:hypothetical protein
VDYQITRHSGFAAPDDALDLLWASLGARHEDALFSKGVREIRARWTVDVPVAMESNERQELGRAAIFEIVRTVCERTPGLRADWYAVRPNR